MQFVPLGDSALLVRLSILQKGEAVLPTLARLRGAAIPGLIEVAPAYESLGVFYDATAVSFETMVGQIERALAVRSRGLKGPASRLLEIPVCHEGEFAPDLAHVAQHTGLAPAEVIVRHAGVTYTVSCVGFMPGFPYLSGLPPELATPRRATPRKAVPAGAVAIGGAQTGIYPARTPGGWHIIGRTSLRLFDANKNPPALLAAGDRVRFRAVKADELER